MVFVFIFSGHKKIDLGIPKSTMLPQMDVHDSEDSEFGFMDVSSFQP